MEVRCSLLPSTVTKKTTGRCLRGTLHQAYLLPSTVENSTKLISVDHVDYGITKASDLLLGGEQISMISSVGPSHAIEDNVINK